MKAELNYEVMDKAKDKVAEIYKELLLEGYAIEVVHIAVDVLIAAVGTLISVINDKQDRQELINSLIADITMNLEKENNAVDETRKKVLKKINIINPNLN